VQLLAVEHRPLWGGREPPRRLRWELFADDLLASLRRHCDEPVWLMGHSMGGTTALLAADREPQRIAGLILLDPVFLPDRFVLAMQLAPASKRRAMPMVRRARQRPERFDSLDDAFAFYRGKRAFRGLDDDALWDYVRASKAPHPDGGVELRFSGAWESAIYETAPRVRPALKRLRLPTLGLRGQDSDTLSPLMFARWQHWQPGAVLSECPGGHLFPLERPREVAEQVRRFLDGQ
jgi:pimeloyl-ACP methyl ester carboxylesterase